VTPLTLFCDLDHRSSAKSEVQISGNVILIAASRKANVFKGIEHLLRLPGVILAVPARFRMLRATAVFYRPYEHNRGDDIEGLSAAIALIILGFAICWALMNPITPLAGRCVLSSFPAHGTVSRRWKNVEAPYAAGCRRRWYAFRGTSGAA